MRPLTILSRGLSLLAGLALLTAAPLRAEDAPLTPAQVDQLLGPIALYPDALVALILPASSVPGDVVLAARYLNSGGDPDQIDYQPWNESVKALARYPVLIKWLDENLSWTQQLGQTFVSQPDEVMSAVQRLRARARANGTLTSTAQQKLVLDGDIIRIVPAEPDVIYVPYYDPSLVYSTPPYYGYPYLTYGVGFPIGIWLSYDVDWHHHNIWVGDSHHNWHNRRDWDHHYDSGKSSGWREWKAPATRPPYAKPDNRHPPGEMPRPGSVPGAPRSPYHDGSGRDANRPDGHRDEAPHQPAAPAANPSPRSNSGDRHGHNDRPVTPPPAAPRPEVAPHSAPNAAVPSPAPTSGRSHGPVPTPQPSPNSPGPVPTHPGPGSGGPPVPRSAPPPNVSPAPSFVPPAPPPPQNPKDSGQPGKDSQSAHLQN